MTAPQVTDYSDRFLLTVHGITSDNSGMAALRTYCEQKLPGIAADSFYYGRVIPFKELTEDTSYAAFLHIRDRLDLINRTQIVGKNRKLFVAAHSFGTLATVRALEMRIPKLAIEGIFLMGSIVPRYYFWDGLIESGQLKQPPFSVVRPLDRVVRGAFAVGGGASGAVGFIANGRYRPLETFKNGGHTTYAKDDGDDLVQFIKGGAGSVPAVDRAIWLKQASILQKVRYTWF